MKERGDGFLKEFQVSHCYVVCSRYIITVCTSISDTSLDTEDEGERRWLPEGIPGITLLCLSVVDILLLSVPVSVIPV